MQRVAERLALMILVCLDCLFDVVPLRLLNVFVFISNSRVRVTWDKSPDVGIAQICPDQRILNRHRVYKFIAIEEPPMGGPIDSALFNEVHGLDQGKEVTLYIHMGPHLPCKQFIGLLKQNNVPSC